MNKIMDNKLTLEEISRMPLDEIEDAYNKGYRLIGKDKRLIVYLQTTCPEGPLNVGDIATLTLSGTQGTAPYTLRFQKNGVDLPNGVFTGVGEGVFKTYVYTILSTDISPIKLLGIVTDSCETPLSCTRYCDITIAVPTITPTPPTITPTPPTITPTPPTITPTPPTITPTPPTITPTPPTITPDRYACVYIPGTTIKYCKRDPAGPYADLMTCVQECMPIITPTPPTITPTPPTITPTPPTITPTPPPCGPVNCIFTVVGGL